MENDRGGGHWLGSGLSCQLEDNFELDIQGFCLKKMKKKKTIFHRTGVSFLFYLFFLGPHPWHVEVPRLGVESELQLPSYTTATATLDLSRVCNLHHSSWQHQILNPLSEVRDWTSSSWVILVGLVTARNEVFYHQNKPEYECSNTCLYLCSYAGYLQSSSAVRNRYKDLVLLKKTWEGAVNIRLAAT